MPKPVDSWWPRFWAWLIDVVIVSVVSWVLFAPFNLDFWGSRMMMDVPHIGVNGLLFLIYWGVLDSEGRQSIGKKAMSLKQVKANGKQPDLMDSFISAFGKAFLLPLDFLIGVLARPGKKLRLFNVASDTVVVKA